jgi:hypothetical protein
MWMIQGNVQKEMIANIGVEKVFDQVLPVGVRLYCTSQRNRGWNSGTWRQALFGLPWLQLQLAGL